MLQNLQNEKQENIANNLKIDNENQDINIKDNNEDKNSSLNSEEKLTNYEIINILLNKVGKNKDLQFKINQSNDMANSLENVKQDIINFYLIEKQKYEEKKREIEINKNYNYNINNKISTPCYNSNSKKIRPNSATKNLKKNKFEKYDKEKISYEIYHQYQKLNFNYNTIPFIQRMELYSLKKCLKDYKIEELTNLQSPKISEKEIIQTFNRLIEDSNRRLFKSKKISKQKNMNETEIKNKKINNNCNKKIKGNYQGKKTFNKKKWDEVYEKRFSSKLKERNDKLEKKRKEKEEKIKKEEDNIIDNLNKKQEILNKRYGMKRNNSANNLTKSSIHSLNSNKYYIGNNKIVTNLNQRLYYNELKKKDFDYKYFLEKANELMDSNEINDKNKNDINNKKGNKNLNIKKNTFRKGATGIKGKKIIHKSSSAYNFIDFDEKNNNKNKEEEKNNFNKIIKEDIDIRISETSIVNNTKIEISGSGSINNKGKNDSAEKIIDRFFEN